MKGSLYLIPSYITDHPDPDIIPVQVKQTLGSLNYFLAENIRTARRYLSSLKIYPSIESLHFETLDKNTAESELPLLIAPLLDGKSMGILSESGCPGIADPGALAVKYAHRHGIKVVPLTGPSSLLLALMASGLNGQQFAFHGYLPIEMKDLSKTINALERESKEKKQTQIFIETPYRNQALFKKLTTHLHSNTLLCVAQDITGEQEFIQTLTVKEWLSKTVELPKLPALFLFLA